MMSDLLPMMKKALKENKPLDNTVFGLTLTTTIVTTYHSSWQ